MKTVKNLTVANIRNYEGFERREDLDFHDDGNNFKGFSYKGMPVTTLRTDGITYLSIRVDYLTNEFTYRQWIETDEYRLCGEFNGVDEFDLDKLIENLEKVIAKRDELNNTLRDERIDTTELALRVAYEIEMAENFVHDFKKTFKWYDVDELTLKQAARYLKALETQIKQCKEMNFKNMSNSALREKQERLNISGYVYISDDNFYIRELRNFNN